MSVAAGQKPLEKEGTLMTEDGCGGVRTYLERKEKPGILNVGGEISFR